VDLAGVMGRVSLMHPDKKLLFVELPRARVLANYYLKTKLHNAHLHYSPAALPLNTSSQVMPGGRSPKRSSESRKLSRKMAPMLTSMST
jgi:hypothetical protein